MAGLQTPLAENAGVLVSWGLKVAMPRYFFDTDDGEQRLRDDEGTEFATLQEACDEAVRILPDIVRDALPAGDRRDFISLVRDENDQMQFRATLSLKTKWLSKCPVEGNPRTSAKKRQPDS